MLMVDTTYSLNVRAQTEGKPSRHRRKVAKGTESGRARGSERPDRPWLADASRELQRQLRQYRDAVAAPGASARSSPPSSPTLSASFAMGAIAQVSYLLSLLLALPTAGFLIRVFIIFHDAGHGSFFRRSRWNRALGYVAGILTFTPFQHWTHEHAMHHATAGDLDRRDLGDVWTMTVQEFVTAPRRLRIAYRVFRNPFVLFFLVAPIGFLFNHRVPRKRTSNRARWAIVWTNIGVALFVVAMSLPFGFVNFVRGVHAGVSGRFYGRHLAVLRPAPVRGRVLAPPRGLGLRRRGAERILLPGAAAGAAVVHRQHRVPPYPPPRSTHPQLPPGARPPGAAACCTRFRSCACAIPRAVCRCGCTTRPPVRWSASVKGCGAPVNFRPHRLRPDGPWRCAGCTRAGPTPGSTTGC